MPNFLTPDDIDETFNVEHTEDVASVDSYVIDAPIENSNGIVELPGVKTPAKEKKVKEKAPAKEKKVKVPKEIGAPKPFVGFTSPIHTTIGNGTFYKISNVLNYLEESMSNANLSNRDVKISTYKNTFRITFKNYRPLELETIVPGTIARMEDNGFFVDGKNKYFFLTF